jgi:predicted nucleic acid-binding protein
VVAYPDTSFLVSLYANDDHGVIANNYLAKNQKPLVLTPFSKSETQHALRLLVFRKEATESILTRHLLTLERDQTEGFLEMASLDFGDVVLHTSQLSHRHAAEFGVGYLDFVHVTSALLIKAQRFLTFDLRQRKLAKALGLDVKI